MQRTSIGSWTRRFVTCQSELDHQTLYLVAHPVRQDTDDSCIRVGVFVPFSQRMPQVLRSELQNLVREDGEDAKIQQDADGGEKFPGGVLRKILFFEHGGGQRCHQGREQGHDFEFVQIFESLAVGHHHDLCCDGQYDQVGESRNRQHAVEQVRAEHEEGDRRLSQNHGHFPVSTASQSVAPVQEPHCLVDPTVLVGEAFDRTAEEDAEEDQQTSIHRTYVCQDNKVKQFEMVAFVALKARVHRPVLRCAAVFGIRRVVDVDAEANAQCRFQHRHESDVPEDHQRQEASLLQVAPWSVSSVVRRFHRLHRPERDPEEQRGGRNQAHVNGDGRNRWMQGRFFGAKAHDRAAISVGRKAADVLCNENDRLMRNASTIGLTCGFRNDDQGYCPSHVQRGNQHGYLNIAECDLL